MSRTNVFLDLEMTVIEQWQNFPTFLPKHCDAIKQFLKDEGETEVTIFSFAIHTEEEVDEFVQFIQSDLEKILECKVIGVVSVPMMQEASEAINKVRFFDVTDFIQLRGKALAFHDWCQKHRLGQLSVLVDDVVRNQTTFDHDTNTASETLNVNKLF